jgi:type II secretory pathway predicted ATPase ExeA
VKVKGYSDLVAANLTLQQQVKEAVMQNNKVEEGEGMVTVEGDVGRGRRTTPRAEGESIRSF